MSSLAMDPVQPFAWPAPQGRWYRNAAAAVSALGLHALAVVLLVAGWAPGTPPEPTTRVLHTQLVSLPAPQPPAPPAPVAEPAPPVPEPVVQPEPLPQQKQIEEAALAHKRAEAQRERQKQRQQARERREAEQRRLEVERQAAEQQRQAEAERQARAAREAAERARQAQAQAQAEAAASRQYLPIAKQAPDYPQRGLDKGLQGDCTVEYRVDPQGRVQDPNIVGDCHPLFIRPSLAAARTFRYQPRIVGGQPVAVPGVRNTFHYRIER
ncbi:energy transducer TonB [Metapseudomonas resinovorans]|uniref:energy transducer TonB n=1 Tax=Metapseudomonas resinovorans TaxID=53412 RepID=UPI0004041CBA|nr:energy transducer TonB [Pseudomonas resinovorans]